MLKTAALPFLFSGIVYLCLGLWIIVRHKNEVQRMYGTLCVVTSFWQGVWLALFSGLQEGPLYVCLKVGYSVIVFIPPIFYHFIASFTQRETKKYLIRLTYVSSFLFAGLIWFSDLFIDGFNRFTWGLSARAGDLHPLFIAFVAAVLLRMIILLVRAAKSEIHPLKRNQILFVLGALFIYSGGVLDLISNYGIAVFPFSSVFSASALGLFTYAIVRRELLAITLPTEDENEHSRRLETSREMRKLGMTTAFPLVSQGELLGYLLLGEKMSEESYSKEDLLLLRIIANQAALAYQRVRYLEMAVRGARTEMLGEIAGGFAHEIKTPLANISLPAELCFIDLTEVEHGKRKIEEVLPELKRRMKDIMQQTFKASDKIEAIRQFSKPGQVQLEAIDVIKIIQGSLSLLDHTLHKYAINLKLEVPEVVPPIRGNGKQLEIVFVNLIKNASEAMASMPDPSARNLWLTVHEDGNWMKISVRDSGPGIKRTDMGHLFEAYFTTKGSTGTGMGLFLSHQVIKAHGGSIEVSSDEARGTEFVVRLPKYSSEIHSGVHEAA